MRLQRLFILVLCAKLASSAAAWGLRMPWSFGFALPVALMAAYIALGLRRHPDDVGDEKFADSCYYLGFIFTITSIVFALFDLPQIGTQIDNIAVRFGAAMVTTVIGLSVRVVLVNFERDADDAIEAAEDALVDASHRFREQLVMARERLRDFESEVDVAARATVERVNLQVEALGKHHAERLDAWLAELAERNQQAFADALSHVGAASARLAGFVEQYTAQMQVHTSALHQFTAESTDRVLERLRTAEFPEDYFVRHLAGPLRQLKNASEEVAANVEQAANAVSRSSLALTQSMKRLREQNAQGRDDPIGVMGELAGGQEALLATTQAQLEVLYRLENALASLQPAERPPEPPRPSAD